MTAEQIDSYNRVQWSKEEFYKARSNGKSWEESLVLARESYNMNDHEFNTMLHELH